MAIDTKTLLNIVNPPCPENLTKKSIPIHLTIKNNSGDTVKDIDLTDAQKKAWLPIMCSASFPYIFLSNNSIRNDRKIMWNFVDLLDELLENSGGWLTDSYEVESILVGRDEVGGNVIDVDLTEGGDTKNGWYYIYANIPWYQVDTYGITISVYVPANNQE